MYQMLKTWSYNNNTVEYYIGFEGIPNLNQKYTSD